MRVCMVACAQCFEVPASCFHGSASIPLWNQTTRILELHGNASKPPVESLQLKALRFLSSGSTGMRRSPLGISWPGFLSSTGVHPAGARPCSPGILAFATQVRYGFLDSAEVLRNSHGISCIHGRLRCAFGCLRNALARRGGPSANASVCLSLPPSVCLSVCLSVRLSVCLCLSVCLNVCLFVCVSVCLSVSLFLSFRLSVVCLSVCLFGLVWSVCLSVRPSVYLSVCLREFWQSSPTFFVTFVQSQSVVFLSFAGVNRSREQLRESRARTKGFTPRSVDPLGHNGRTTAAYRWRSIAVSKISFALPSASFFALTQYWLQSSPPAQI